MVQIMKKTPAVLLAGLIAVAAAFAVGAFTAQEAYADVPIGGLYVGNSGEITTTGEIPDTGATSGTATVSTDEETNSIVLTLEDFSYEGEGQSAAIYYYNEMNNSVSLIIKLVGENSVVCTKEGSPGIRLQTNNLIITSDSNGTLDVSGEATGIYNALKSLTINDCAVTAAGVDVVSLAVNDGSLDADGGNYGIQVGSNKGAAITGDSVVAATGNTKAINGPVKNAIPGKGWADTAGTGVASDILESRNGQQLDYKKVVFALHKHKDAEGNEITFQPWNEKNRLPGNGEGNYYLACDVPGPGGLGLTSTYNLCLNGHDVGRQFDFRQQPSGTLNLYDCEKSGSITNMEIYVGTFNMYGGTISGNSTSRGGGIRVDGSGTFNMYGGTISDNSVSDHGGGVIIEGGTFNMYGGTITDNTATNGGGVSVLRGTFNMSGGTISGNSAEYGGGIYVSSIGNISLSGSPQITGNTANNEANNLYLGTSKADITGELNTPEDASGPQIGISMYKPGVFTSGLAGKLPDGKTAADIFFSDDDDCEIRVTNDGEAQLVAFTNIEKGTCSFNDATYSGEEVILQTMTLKLSEYNIRELKLDTDYTITKFKDGNGADMGTAKPKYAGTYTAAVEGIGDCKGNTEVSFTIKPAPLTIKVKDQTLTYNGQIQGEGDTVYADAAQIAEKVTIKGLQPGDELTAIQIDGQGQAAGTYPLTPFSAVIENNGTKVTGSYAITYVDGKLTITKSEPKPTPPQPTPQPTVNKAAAKTALDAGVVAKSSGSKVTASWGAVKGASSYVIYANYCDQKKCRKIKTVSGKTTSFSITKLNGKKFNPKKNLKFYVVAYQKVNGKNVKLARSIMAHAPGSKNSGRTNVTGVKVKKASFTLKKGKTAKIKGKLVLQKKGKKPLKHEAKFRYASSNKKVAKVSKKGKITAVGKGKCTVYVYAVSGVSKKIKVTVK